MVFQNLLANFHNLYRYVAETDPGRFHNVKEEFAAAAAAAATRRGRGGGPGGGSPGASSATWWDCAHVSSS
jgi:hypothetical protein